MKVIILNGSPKGAVSVTMQYVEFVQQNFPQHELEIINISQKIKKLENDDDLLQNVVERIKSSDAVLWAFPVYFFLVPSQYKRFIELLWERDKTIFFEGKYTGVLSTSIHFYDHTAHNYMRAVCDDLRMNYIGSYSADMSDLNENDERERLLQFAEDFFDGAKNKIAVSRAYKPLSVEEFGYAGGNAASGINVDGKKVLILTDSVDDKSNLGGMVEVFRKCVCDEVEVINLNKLNIKDGCIGCLQCSYDNECVFKGVDDFVDFYDTKVKTADIIIFAGNIKDRYLSSKWKAYFDRSFFNNHVPTLVGKQVGFIVSGPLSEIPNLREILEAYTELNGANLVDFVTDECGDSTKMDALLESLALRIVRFSHSEYIKPSTFLSIGGKKVLRDAIWGDMRFPFLADHKYYKSHNLYDFPHRNLLRRFRNSVMLLLIKIPAIRNEIYIKRMKSLMLKSYKKVLGKQTGKT
jgi:multimeric flavodoxin WrbA